MMTACCLRSALRVGGTGVDFVSSVSVEVRAILFVLHNGDPRVKAVLREMLLIGCGGETAFYHEDLYRLRSAPLLRGKCLDIAQIYHPLVRAKRRSVSHLEQTSGQASGAESQMAAPTSTAQIFLRYAILTRRKGYPCYCYEQIVVAFGIKTSQYLKEE